MKKADIEGEKDIVWLPKEIADKFKDIETIEGMRSIARDVIEQKRLDMTTEDRNLEDDILRFKSFCLSHRSEMSKVYNQECDLINAMWEELSDKADGTRTKIKNMSKEISEFSRSVGKLKEQLGGLEIYRADRFLELSNTINNMDDSTRDILKRVLNAAPKK